MTIFLVALLAMSCLLNRSSRAARAAISALALFALLSALTVVDPASAVTCGQTGRAPVVEAVAYSGAYAYDAELLDDIALLSGNVVRTVIVSPVSEDGRRGARLSRRIAGASRYDEALVLRVSRRLKLAKLVSTICDYSQSHSSTRAERMSDPWMLLSVGSRLRRSRRLSG